MGKMNNSFSSARNTHESILNIIWQGWFGWSLKGGRPQDTWIKLIQVRAGRERGLISLDEEFYLPSWSDKQDHFSFGHISSLRPYILVIRAAWDLKRFIVQLIDYINDTDVKIIPYFTFILFPRVGRENLWFPFPHATISRE